MATLPWPNNPHARALFLSCLSGRTALIAPTVIPPDIVHFDSLAMLAVSVALLVLARTEGLALLACYGAYLNAIWPA